jgi:hypothetical protein
MWKPRRLTTLWASTACYLLHDVIYQKTELFDTNSVPTSQRIDNVLTRNTNRLMLFRETNALYSENHEEDLDTNSKHNTEFLNAKERCRRSNHCSL